jgi:hypothetical protein
VINVATSSVAETSSSVAMTPDGRFDVAWEQVYSGNDHDIWMKSYSASGIQTGIDAVAYSTAHDQSPSISMDNAGDAVVAWESNFNVKARRISSTGVMGAEINIASTAAIEEEPSVALRRDGGGFVVAYQSDGETAFGIKVAEVSAFDSVTTYDAGVRADPAVSIDAFGDYLLTDTGDVGSSTADIHARRGILFY